MEYPSLDTAKAGAIRFNTDSSQMEIYDGNQWVGVEATSPFLQTGGTRALRGGGAESPGFSNTIDFFNLDIPGNATDFGNLTNGYASNGQGFASRTRGFFASGYNSGLGGYVNNIEFVTIASTGNATDFGDMLAGKQGIGALSSSTRGIINAGSDAGAGVNVIQYVTMAQQGNALDFGDLTVARSYARGCASPTRGVNAGGYPPGGGGSQVIDYTTISTLGNTADFGDLFQGTKAGIQVSSNAVRGILAGGAPSTVNTISFITIATLGDSKEFGDLSRTLTDGAAMASSTRFCAAGGGSSNKIEYVQIMSTGNSIDFGDLTQSIAENAGCSNGHGGL